MFYAMAANSKASTVVLNCVRLVISSSKILSPSIMNLRMFCANRGIARLFVAQED